MKTSVVRVGRLLADRSAYPWITDIENLFLYGSAYDEVAAKLCRADLIGASTFFSDTGDRLRKKHQITETVGVSRIYYALGGRENAWSMLAADWADWLKERSPPLECEISAELGGLRFSAMARLLDEKPAMLIGNASIWRAEATIRGMLDAASAANIVDGAEFLQRLTARVHARSRWSWPQTSDPFVLISLQSGDDASALKILTPLFREVVQEYPALG